MKSDTKNNTGQATPRDVVGKGLEQVNDDERVLRIAFAAYDRTEGKGFKTGNVWKEWRDAKREVTKQDAAMSKAA